MQMLEDSNLDLSIIMPCLNEEATVGLCVDDAMEFLQKNRLRGEVIVVDNGSTDHSGEIASAHGARVLTESHTGYGSALQTGIKHSHGRVLILGDCDTTYDFLHLENMYKLLASQKCDMIIGNRYAGGIESGSMPLSHKWGVRFLSFCGRVRFQTSIYDFHCGLRGLTRESAMTLNLHTTGMEFATEMIAEATRCRLHIEQLPVTLRKCTFNRSSKLRTIRDGFRHLRYIFTSRR